MALATAIGEATPNIFKTVSVTAAGNSALWTPATGTKFRLMRYHLMLTGNVTMAVAGVLTVELRDGTTNSIDITNSLYVPTASSNVLGGFSLGWIDLGHGFLSSTANNVLNVNLSAALLTGALRVIACGTEE